jgi:hypothetical protein
MAVTTNLDQNASLNDRPAPFVRSAQTQPAASASSTLDESPLTVTPRNTASDMVETNYHTSNLEFYGSASSVAFLRHVETLSNGQPTDALAGSAEHSLTSILHNTEFMPDTSRDLPPTIREANLHPDRFYFRVARRFLDAYFSNIHYIQPVLDEEAFLERCEDLWFDRTRKQPLSFTALYYATMSLGSLVMKLDSPEIAGSDRFTWSRKLYNEASAIMSRLGTATDMETVQCAYMMVTLSPLCEIETPTLTTTCRARYVSMSLTLMVCQL